MLWIVPKPIVTWNEIVQLPSKLDGRHESKRHQGRPQDNTLIEAQEETKS